MTKNIDNYEAERKAVLQSNQMDYELDDTVIRELDSMAIKIPLDTSSVGWDGSCSPSFKQFFMIDNIGIRYTARHSEHEATQHESVELQRNGNSNDETYGDLQFMLKYYGFALVNTKRAKSSRE